jgi:hypothetical protein
MLIMSVTGVETDLGPTGDKDKIDRILSQVNNQGKQNKTLQKPHPRNRRYGSDNHIYWDKTGSGKKVQEHIRNGKAMGRQTKNKIN